MELNSFSLIFSLSIPLIILDIVFWYYKDLSRIFFFQNKNWFQNRVSFEIIYSVRYLIRSLYLTVLAIIFLGDNSLIIGKIIWYMFVSYFILKFYMIYAHWFERVEIRNLKKTPVTVQRNVYLYSWLGEANIRNTFIYDALSEEVMGKSDISNLKKVKWHLKQKIGDNVADYHLLKSFLEAQQKNSISEVSHKFFAPLLAAVCTLLVRAVFTIDWIKEKLEVFSIGKNTDFKTYISYIPDIILFTSFIVFTVIFTSSLLNKDKKRIGAIIAVLDNMIYEKEKAEGNK